MAARDCLADILHEQGAYCGLCDYESRDCKDCERMLGQYADAILDRYLIVERPESWGRRKR
jgi:hypothetical protein